MKHFLTLLILATGIHLSAQQTILDSGHSHNDYTHEHPLFDALGYGYKSIEIDVWLHKGRLIVDHDGIGLDSGRDIDELYLLPIADRVKAHHGWVYDGDSTPTIFMIEFKNEPEACYTKLKELIAKHAGLFCDRFGQGGPIKLVITGHRPWASLLKGDATYITADGPISKSADSIPPHIMERVSDPYGEHFSWKGAGAMPKGQRARLDTMVKIAHAHGRQIRFYGMPQNENVWRTLLDAGVDWINIDELGRFATFYAEYLKTHGRSPNCHCVRM